MARSNKLFLIISGIILVVILCNLTGAILGSQAGTLASSAANIAQSQALSEQARANQQMARALQSVAHTMNLMLLVVFLLAVLGTGLYVWKTKMAPPLSTPPTLPTPNLRSGLCMCHVPGSLMTMSQLPLSIPIFKGGEILEALLSGEEWESP